MSWFGLDFNGDGKVSFTEHMFTLDMLGFFDEEKKKESANDYGDSSDDFDESRCDAQVLDLSDEIDQLDARRTDLQDALFDLELNEPDMFSPAYEAWEERRDALESRISALDDAIFDLDFEY